MLISIILICISGAVFYGTKDYESSGLESIGAGFWPRLLAITLFILSVVLFIQSIFQKGDGNFKLVNLKSPGIIRVIKISSVLLIFCIILKVFGFLIAILYLVPPCMYILGEKRIGSIIGVTVSVVLLVYVVFVVLLKIQLPEGILF